METIKLNYQDILICDPCYIKAIRENFGTKELRFDALKLIKTLHEGDDGSYLIRTAHKAKYLGVDSGRIWELQAEFECEVEIESGMSGHLVIRKEDSDWGNDIYLDEEA